MGTLKRNRSSLVPLCAILATLACACASDGTAVAKADSDGGRTASAAPGASTRVPTSANQPKRDEAPAIRGQAAFEALGFSRATMRPATGFVTADGYAAFTLRGRPGCVISAAYAKGDVELTSFVSGGDRILVAADGESYELTVLFPEAGLFTVQFICRGNDAAGRESYFFVRYLVETTRGMSPADYWAGGPKAVKIAGENAFAAAGFARGSLEPRNSSLSADPVAKLLLKGRPGAAFDATFVPGRSDAMAGGAKAERFRFRDSEGYYRLLVGFDAPGEYTLFVRGLVQGPDGKGEFTLRLFVNAKRGVGSDEFLELTSDPPSVRNQALADACGLSLPSISRRRPPDAGGRLYSVEMTAKPDADLRATLLDRQFGGLRLAFPERVVMWRDGPQIRFAASFPTSGDYALVVEARTSSGAPYEAALLVPLEACAASAPAESDTLFAGARTEASRAGDARRWLVMSRNVRMRTGSLELLAYHEAPRAGMMTAYLDTTAAYLPALERYLGSDFPHRRLALVLDETNAGISYQLYGSGVNLSRSLAVKSQPPVLLHEFAHFYTGGWFGEGVASFLPIAMAEAGYLDPSVVSKESVYLHWGFKDPARKGDKPVGELSSYDNPYLYYTKTFKLQYLLWRELGADAYRRFLADILKTGTGEGIYAFADFLAAYKAIDWRAFLSGWLYAGPYSVFSPDDFRDTDKNGLLQIEDYYAKNRNRQNNPVLSRESPGGIFDTGGCTDGTT